MPNITFTSVSFTGPFEDLVKLHRLLSTDKDISHTLLPVPPFDQHGKAYYGDAEKMAEQQAIYNLCKKAYGYESDYDFVNDVWGSKWGIADVEVFDKELTPGANSFSVSWRSAWCPAYGLMYEPHDIVLKNPQGLVDLIAMGQTKKPRGFLQADGFADIVNHGDDATQYAYLVEYAVQEPENDEDEDYDRVAEPKPREKIPEHIGHTFLKAEAYLNGFVCGTAYAVQAGPQLDVLNLWFPKK
jgi:hypothetical protein